MMQGRPLLLLATVLGASTARGEAIPPRPDLNTLQPVATCALQVLTNAAQSATDRPALLYSLQPPAEDPLANYERTPLGDWQMPAQGNRSDPWLRLLLLAPERPVVIDLAVFIDGKGFRERREVWIDEVLAAAKTQVGGNGTEGNKAAETAGTNGADGASVGGASSLPSSEEGSPPKDDATVAAQARKAPMMRERLMNYVATSGGEIQREEVHWLLAEWGAGPAIIVLGPSLSWQRASVAPLLAYLDQNADGGLSATEISQADTLMKRADADGNDVVDVSELRRQSDRPATITRPSGHSLVMMLDANTNWDLLAENLMRVYRGNAKVSGAASAALSLQDRIAHSGPALNGSQLEELCSVPADIALRVDFTTAKTEDKQSNAVSLLSTATALASGGEGAAVATADAISVAVGGDFVEFSAAQPAASDTTDAAASQLAIGAVIDGSSLERLLDRDQDGRFTLRERQELGGLLAALDQNQDGQVAAEEIPVPIRLAVTLGPQVHELLRAPTGSVRAISPRTPVEAPPDWFVSMDKNGDRDLARGEFLGTTEQFRQFDTDGDGLLSVAEVLKLDGTQ
jgi:hypothetical protein